VSDSAFQAAIDFARDLIRIPGLPGAEGDVAERVRQEMERLRFNDVWIDDVGNVIGRIRGRARTPAVMLSCHLDVVDIGERESWHHDPFGGEIVDGFLHGRGAMDIKGPLALQTHAAGVFAGTLPPADIYVAHTVLEERGGWGMEYLLQTEGVAPDVVIIGEATAGDICIGHRGRAEMIVEVSGRAGHASAPERALNPLAMLPRLMPALDRFSDGLDSDPVLGRSTAAPTAIETLPRSRNVIPDRLRVVLDWRVLPGTTPETAANALRDAIRQAIPDAAPYTIDVRFASEQQRTYTGRERERLMFTPGFLMSAEHPVVSAAASSIERSTGSRPAIRPWTFATDGGHSCGVHGIPTIGFAPGEERYAHTNRERLSLADAEVAFAAYPALIEAVRNAGDPS
jgi:succinyl-diaminopimelate desuccinylase